jgi:RNA polymerase sigma factor for flagellar operon FliA
MHVEFEELVQAGVMGLIDAATKHDSGKDIAFQAYAKHRVRGAILDSLRQADWASRNMRKRQKKVEAITRELMEELDRHPTEAEIADKMGMGVERFRQMAVDMQTTAVVSSTASDDDTQAAPDFPARPDTRPDFICERTQLGATLRFAIGSLPERYQSVVFMYYTKEMTMKKIGAKMDINQSRVSQIQKVALEKMAMVLQSSGIPTTAALI